MNIGDTYLGRRKSGSIYGGISSSSYENNTKWFQLQLGRPQSNSIYPEKSLSLLPYRIALAMVDKGWILRNIIVWHKPNALPQSVKDRFSNKYEVIFFFTKSQRYYFNLDAVKVPMKTTTIKRIFYDNFTSKDCYAGLNISNWHKYVSRMRKKIGNRKRRIKKFKVAS